MPMAGRAAMRRPPRPGILLSPRASCAGCGATASRCSFAIGMPLHRLRAAGATFSNAVIRDLSVSVVDADHSPTSRTYVQAIASAPGVTIAQRSDDLNGAMHADPLGRRHRGGLYPARISSATSWRAKRPQIVIFYNRQYFTPGNIAAQRALERDLSGDRDACRRRRRPERRRSRRDRWSSSNMS